MLLRPIVLRLKDLGSVGRRASTARLGRDVADDGSSLRDSVEDGASEDWLVGDFCPLAAAAAAA